MNFHFYLLQRLNSQGLSVYETDLPYIQSVLNTMNLAQAPLQLFANLNKEIPITIVDKELIV